MKIRMLTSIAGAGFSRGPGEEWDTDDKQAIRLINAGYAVPVVEKVVETATLQPVVERRSRPRPKASE